MSKYREDLDGQFLAARVAIENAIANTNLHPSLELFGYDVARLSEGRALYEQALELHQQQTVEYGEQYAATEAFDSTWKEAKATYMRNLKVARVALKRDRVAQQSLALNGTRKQSLSGWLAQARQFYKNAQADANILSKLGRFGMSQEKLAAAEALVDAVETAKLSQERERGEAQAATNARDEAMDAMNEWLNDFMAIARIALEDDPQQLETLGIVAPS